MCERHYGECLAFVRLTRLTSSSAVSSSVFSSRETWVGPRAEGEPFPLQSLCSGSLRWLREGGLELCMLAERYRYGTYRGTGHGYTTYIDAADFILHLRLCKESD